MQLGYPPYEGCKLQLRIALFLIQYNYEKAVPFINVSQPTPTSSMANFSPPNSPNPKDLQLNIMYDKEKHQILTFEKLERANV